MGESSTSGPTAKDRLRALPSVDAVLALPALAEALAAHPRPRVVDAVRSALAAARLRLQAGEERGFDPDDVQRALRTRAMPGLRPVLNATGVVLHTNLGRAPLAEEACAQVVSVARGYSNLEFDLATGERGSRFAPVVGALRELTGAEDALVVNNCAAATLLAFTALAEGREVVVSRGELVEIGGGFRVPDVMAESGAGLVEVGTTNRTRRADYERALSERTGLVAKVHRSNFALVGFTEDVPVSELAPLCAPRGLPLFVDAGSGHLLPLDVPGFPRETTMRDHVEAGADLVAFSGDKLLGGPQAGILVGRAALVARLRSHPLHRAVRVDKLTVAALEATLALYRDGRQDAVPARALLAQGAAQLQRRAEALRAALAERGVEAEVVAVDGQSGGGTLPLARIPS
ncbi:MAG TPA: L-seryl-tRNA(Sec) selenium transferase, partial [Myxococcaceae bacterium]|nr:L-seryl-tRNA(Sec) selenium transferase [Myxococcaceae bacterium]